MKKAFSAVAAVAVLTMGIIGFPGPAPADEITDTINEALTQYKSSDYTEAAGSLTYALQLIAQKKGEQLLTLFPEPLSGWTAEDATSETMNAALMGGGINAERRYSKEQASDSDQESVSVTIKYVADSPMLQGMMMMFSNPAFATSDGGKLEKIGGEKAIVKYEASDKNGTINIAVANRMLVTVEGNGVSKEELKNYAAAVNYKKLAAMP